MSEIIKVKNKKTGEIITLRRKQDTITQEKKPVEFWKSFGAEITPAMKRSHPYLSAIAKTGQDISTIPAHYFNQFLLNLPRAGLKAAGIEFPKTTSPVAGLAAKGAGVAGAMVGVGPKLFAKTGQLATKAIPRLAGKGLLKQMGRGAVAGGVTGAAYTPTEAGIPVIAPKERAIQFGFGATLGGLFEAAHAGGAKGVREFRKFRYAKRPLEAIEPGIKRETKVFMRTPTGKKVGYQAGDVQTKAREKIVQIKKNNYEATKVIKDNIKSLSDDLQKGTEGKSLEYQDRLPKFFRANGEAYGQRLDNVSEDLIKKGMPAKISDTNRIITKSISEADDAFIESGPARQALNKLKEKYGIVSKEKVSPILTERGQPFKSEITTNANKPVNFQEFVNDIRQVSKGLSASAKAGERFAQEDIAVAILNKNFGEFVSQKVPAFKQLQNSYKPVVQAMKVAGKVFKPYAGELKTKTGTQFLKRAAMGKLEAGERKLIELIESGSEFAPGVGKLSEPIMKLGRKILNAKEMIQAQKELQKIGVDRVTANKVSRLSQLETRKRTISALTATKQKAQSIKKALLYGTGLAVGGSAGIYGITKAIKGIPEAIGGESSMSGEGF